MVVGSQISAVLHETTQPGQLATTKSSVDIGQSEIEAHSLLLMVIARLTRFDQPTPISRDSVVAYLAHRLRKIGAIGRDGSALPGGDAFHRMKTENRGV